MITLEMWNEFADAVEAHIRDYTIPQYGDWPDDQMSTFTDEDITTSIQRYENRRGKGARGHRGGDAGDCLRLRITGNVFPLSGDIKSGWVARICR